MDINSIKSQLYSTFDTEFSQLQKLCCYMHIYVDKSVILDDLSYPETIDIQTCYGLYTSSISKEEYVKMLESGLTSSHLIFKFKTKLNEYVNRVGVDDNLRISSISGTYAGFTDESDMTLTGIYITRNHEDYENGTFVDKNFNIIPSISGRVIMVKKDPIDAFITWYLKKTEG